MKRSIFIIDDRIKDARGFLLTLYAVLSDHFNKEEELKARFGEIELYYIDILWDDKPEVLQDREKRFTRSLVDVEQHVQGVGIPVFSRTEYLYCSFSEESYRNQDNRSQLAEKVYDIIRKKQEDDSPYVILLDIILNNNMDMGEILNKSHVLSTLLFKIDARHCIVYSTYDNFVYDDWKLLVQESPNCVRREWLCRGRRIDLEYQRLLLNALELAQNGDGHADG